MVTSKDKKVDGRIEKIIINKKPIDIYWEKVSKSYKIEDVVKALNEDGSVTKNEKELIDEMKYFEHVDIKTIGLLYLIGPQIYPKIKNSIHDADAPNLNVLMLNIFRDYTEPFFKYLLKTLDGNNLNKNPDIPKNAQIGSFMYSLLTGTMYNPGLMKLLPDIKDSSGFLESEYLLSLEPFSSYFDTAEKKMRGIVKEVKKPEIKKMGNGKDSTSSELAWIDTVISRSTIRKILPDELQISKMKDKIYQHVLTITEEEDYNKQILSTSNPLAYFYSIFENEAIKRVIERVNYGDGIDEFIQRLSMKCYEHAGNVKADLIKKGEESINIENEFKCSLSEISLSKEIREEIAEYLTKGIVEYIRNTTTKKETPKSPDKPAKPISTGFD